MTPDKIEDYIEKVYGYAVHHTYSSDEADELSQEILYTAIRELPKLRDDSRFEPWLWGVAANVTKSFRRTTLHEQIGMTDDEIRECGFRSLSEYFDKPSYAQTIAEWLVKVGTENTTSCNMIIGFEKVNERYGVNLYEDEFLCDEIVEQLYRHEAILDVVTDENTFDMNFGYLYCPYGEEHEELTM